MYLHFLTPSFSGHFHHFIFFISSSFFYFSSSPSSSSFFLPICIFFTGSGHSFYSISSNLLQYRLHHLLLQSRSPSFNIDMFAIFNFFTISSSSSSSSPRSLSIYISISSSSCARRRLLTLVLFTGHQRPHRSTDPPPLLFRFIRIRKRIPDLAGSLEILSEPGRGCEVMMRVPFERRPDGQITIR